MAKIRMSGIGIAQISGRIGGQVFAHNKGGMYVRTNGKATNTQTPAQTALRSIFSMVSKTWGQLTEAQVRAWNQYGLENPKTDVFGESRPQTGFGAFVGVNQNRLHSGFSGILNLPMAKIMMPSVKIDSLIIDKTTPANSEIDLVLGDNVLANEVVASIGFAVVKQGSKRGFGSVKNKFGNRIRIPVPAGSTVSVTSAALADVLGMVVAGDQVYVQVHLHTADGQKSNEVTDSTIVV